MLLCLFCLIQLLAFDDPDDSTDPVVDNIVVEFCAESGMI